MMEKQYWFEIPIKQFKHLIPKRYLRKTGMQQLRIYTDDKGNIQKVTLVWFYKRMLVDGEKSHYVRNDVWKEWRLL